MIEARDILFKFGSTSVADERGMDRHRLDRYSQQLAELHNMGLLHGIVSSGSVKAGQAIDPLEKDEQVLAAQGSAVVVTEWQRHLRKFGVRAGQVLTTHHEMDDPGEGSALLLGMKKLNRAGVVPIVNENDLLSEEELRKRPLGGDNDRLAAHLAQILGSDALYIVTAGVKGLMRADGKYLVRTIASEAMHSRGVYAYDEALEIAGYVEHKPENSMASKVKALVDLANIGIQGYIGSSTTPFREVLNGNEGTKVLPTNGQNV